MAEKPQDPVAKGANFFIIVSGVVAIGTIIYYAGTLSANLQNLTQLVSDLKSSTNSSLEALQSRVEPFSNFQTRLQNIETIAKNQQEQIGSLNTFMVQQQTLASHERNLMTRDKN